MKHIHLVLLLIAFASLEGAAAQKPQLTVATDKQSYVLGEPIILIFTLTNDSKKPVPIDLGYNDITNISFVLNVGEGEVVVPYKIHRSGLNWPGELKLLQSDPSTATSSLISGLSLSLLAILNCEP